MNRVYAYLPTNARTASRYALLINTIKEAMDTCGYDMRLTIFTSNEPTFHAAVSAGAKYALIMGSVGQHVITNYAIKEASEQGFTHLLRLDDDVSFLTKRWLAKMMEASDKLGPRFILSPTVRGLMHPPQTSEPIDVEGIRVRFALEAMGGICRLAPLEALHYVDNEFGVDTWYTSDVRAPMGFGDATGIGRWCQVNQVWMAYLDHVRVKHTGGTAKQREDSAYAVVHDVMQHVPHLPPWTPQCT